MKSAVRLRARFEAEIRKFFTDAGLAEVKTPLLSESPGFEPHIRPFRACSHDQEFYLPTSPEFSMKRLLVENKESIFQINQAFRDEPLSTTHLPEFTLLEWYRVGPCFEKIQEDCEKLLVHLSQTFLDSDEIHFQGTTINLTPPWPRITVDELFAEKLDLKLEELHEKESLVEISKALNLSPQSTDSWDDLFFRIWLNKIEPHFPKDKPLIVTHYPESQAALSKTEKLPNGITRSRRFEFFIGGLELGNGFDELTAPEEHRRRYENEMKIRQRTYGDHFPRTPLGNKFISSIEQGLPECAGIAVGVDRLLMLIADESDIRNTVWMLPNES